MSTAFSILFAVATLATFALGLWPSLRNARIAAATVAVLSFLMALVTAR
jgi:hypothetical protein